VPDRRLSVRLRQQTPIPLDVAFTCEPGRVLAIFGPSGSGKTTILRSIAGLTTPADAAVHAGNETWIDTESAVVLPAHRRAVGYVFQEYALFPHLTAAGNVMAALGHRPRAERRALAARLLPAVLLLDEPFAAIDRSVRRRLQEEIDTLRRTLEIPLILVTHDFDDVLRLATDLLVLDRGRCIASGALPDLTSRPDLPWLRDAVGLGSVFDATVAHVDPVRGLSALTFEGGTLLAGETGLAPGRRVRVRIPARDVILATERPVALSLHNTLAGSVSAVRADGDSTHAIVQVAVGETRLLAEVTRDAIASLGIAVGMPIHALIKSVSIELHS
jgi:molybdate transport system ATP-binding protein